MIELCIFFTISKATTCVCPDK